MPTFAKTKIADFTYPTTGWHFMRHNAARDASGKIWVIYTDTTKRYIYLKTSTDNGSTWSAAEQVHDYGAAEANAYAIGIMIGQQDDRAAMWTMRNNGGNYQLFYKRRGASSWPAAFESSQAVNISSETDGFLFQDASGFYWTLFLGTSGGDTRVAAVPSASANDLTSWGGGTVKSFVASGTGFRAWQQNSFACAMDRTGNIHVILSDQNPSASGHYAILYCKFTTSTTTWGSVEVVKDTGTATNIRKPVLLHVDVDDSDVPYCNAQWYDTGTVYQCYWYSRSGGTWSAGELVHGSVDATYNKFFQLNVLTGAGGNNASWCTGDNQGYGTNTTKYNPQYFTRASGAFVRTGIQDISTDNGSRNGPWQAVKKYMRCSVGAWVLGTNSNAIASELFCWVSSDQVWGSETAAYNKTITQTIAFTHSLAPQGWVIRTVSSGTVSRIPGGGRQIIRTAGGVLWHCYYEGGALKTSYSSDEGANWTIINVGPTWVPAGMAMCVGIGDEPVLVATRPSNNDFYIYQYNGTSWVLKKQLNAPVAETESMQILLFGSTYMLVFAYITSTNDRRIYSKTSADLVTWATSVLMKNGDGSGTGPQKYRRLAACVDGSGDVHAVYSIRSSSNHKLYYRKYSGGAWGTEQLITTGSGGNNVSDYQSGLSIAVDAAGTVHMAARVKVPTFSSRVKVVYYRRVSGVWSVEDVHSAVDADQDFPSLSLNGTRPLICWASSGLGLGAVRALRASDGSSWAYSQITTDVRDSLQTVHGPSFGTSYNYSRGVVGSMRGSEEYFQSSDALSGSAAFMENTINFGSILSTLQRVMSNAIDFTQSLVGVRSIGFTNTINFSHRLNFTRERTMSSTLEFRQNLGGSTATEVITQTLIFAHSLAGVKTPIKSITQTINFESRLTQVRAATITTSIEFSGIMDVNILKQKSITQTITFGSTLGLNFSLNKLLTNTLRFLQGLIGYKADEGCEPSFTPDRPIAAPDDLDFVYFIGPVPELTLSIQLKKPEYGNARRQSLQIKINRTRGGKLRPHAKSPTYEPQTMTFANVSYLKLEQTRNFLRTTKGRKIYYLDERNRKWVGYMIGSDVDLADEDHERGGSFTVEFEGTLV